MSTPAFAYPTLCQERKGWGTRTLVARTTKGEKVAQRLGTLEAFLQPPLCSTLSASCVVQRKSSSSSQKAAGRSKRRDLLFLTLQQAIVPG
jgi:hypothetical protein